MGGENFVGRSSTLNSVRGHHDGDLEEAKKDMDIDSRGRFMLTPGEKKRTQRKTA